MLQQRRQGLSTLIGTIHWVAVPLWFTALAAITVEGLGLMTYSQVTYELYLLVLAAAGFFNLQNREPPVVSGPARHRWNRGIRQANREMLVFGIVLIGLIWATKDKAISRQFVGLFLMTTWVGLVFSNRVLPPQLGRRFFSGPDDVRTILVGAPHRAERLKSWTEAQRGMGVNVRGIVVFQDSLAEASACPVLGSIEQLDAILERERVQQVILLENRQSTTWVQFVTDAAFRQGSRLLVLSPWDEYFNQSLSVVEEGDLHFFTLRDEPLQNPFNRLIKRSLDLMIALPVCLFVLPPLALWVAWSHRREAPGPLFFRQVRGGAESRRFTILKFRTMRERPREDEAHQATPGDPRVFPFGQFLRKSSLDEIPQFLNVLRGSMSVVGPRPHLLAHDETFAEQVERYRTRHHVKPGITGMAQHLGYRGEIVKQEDIAGRVRLDLEYIQTWSIWLDLGIIIKTAWQILFPPKTAY